MSLNPVTGALRRRNASNVHAHKDSVWGKEARRWPFTRRGERPQRKLTPPSS